MSLVVPFTLTGTTADESVSAIPCTLFGWSLREQAATAAPATALVRNGTDVNGQVVCSIELSGDQSTTMWFGPHGIRMDVGCFFDRVAGTITGAVYVG